MAEAKNQNGVRIVDPNPQGENISHEDLMVYVKLKAITKSRSIVQEEPDRIVELEQELSNVPDETNYTYPAGAKHLTTDWTGIGGSVLEGGTDLGGFGITSIDIDIKSSFIPQIQIQFVDIRGATLFEQGPCSPYASFFHMPYPVFELTIKGFYGKPVTYTLALTKFNTKFNPSTGNFEIKADFIGYTYAFLADLSMGYALAAPYMTGGDQKLQALWDEVIRDQNEDLALKDVSSQVEDNLSQGKYATATEILNKNIDDNEARTENRLPEKAITLKQMIEDINSLEKVLGEVANSEEFQDVSRLNSLRSLVDQLEGTINNFINEPLILKAGGEIISSGDKKSGLTQLRIPKTKATPGETTTTEATINDVRELVVTYFGKNKPTKDKPQGIYETQIGAINNNKAKETYLPNVSIPTVKTSLGNELEGRKNQKGLYVTDLTSTEKDEYGEYYYIDLGAAFLLENRKFLVKLDEVLSKLQEENVDTVNQAVKKVLGYTPTIRNVMTIILTNMELFLKLLVEASYQAEITHEGKGVVQDVISGTRADLYPWPTYHAINNKVTGAPGTSVEQYPGTNAELRYWEEVKFTEDFLTAYLELKEDLELITGDVEGKRGFDNMIPLNPMESRLLDVIDDKVKPNAYYRDEDYNTVLKNIGERAFLVGDYTLVNGLTGWKSREMHSGTPGRLNNATPLATVFNNNGTQGTKKYRLEVNKPIRIVDASLMKKYGEVDGINAVNTIATPDLLFALQTLVDGDSQTFKDNVIKQIVSGLETPKFSDWVTSENSGVSSSNIIKLLKKMATGNNSNDGGKGKQYFNDLTDDSIIYTYSNQILIGDDNNGVAVSSNPWNDDTFRILDAGDIDGSTTLSSTKIKGIASSGTGPWGKSGIAATIRTREHLDYVLIEATQTDGLSIYKLDSQTQVPTVQEEKRKHFLRLVDWDKVANYSDGEGTTSFQSDGNLSIGSIDQYNCDGFDGYTTVDFGTPWSTNSGTGDALVQTPLWARNLTTSQQYKYPKDKSFVNSGEYGYHTDEEQSLKALAFLNLISVGWVDANDPDAEDGEGYANWSDGGNLKTSYDGHSAVPFFRGVASQVNVPRHFTLLTGALLWRLRETNYFPDMPSQGNSGPNSVNNDPIIWTLASTGTYGFKKFEPIHHPHIFKEGNSFALIHHSCGVEYMRMDDHMTTLLNLPTNIKEQFIDKFEKWSLGIWKKEYLDSFDPLSSGGFSNMFDYYINIDTGAYRYGVRHSLSAADSDSSAYKDNEQVHNMYTELFDEYDIIGYATPKAFYGIAEQDISNKFNIRKEEFDAFVDGWIKGFKSAIDERLTAIRSGDDSEDIAGKNAMNDPDIKLNLYKSFKSIFDKWVARSSGGNNFKMFYNKVSNNSNKNRLLIDHFNFIDRGFNDIGYKAVVDMTLLKKIAEDPTASLYQTVTELLSKNNFDFHPLPAFIQYGKESLKDLEQMFEPVTTLNNINTSPSFVCMYIGGNSKHLDIGQSSTFCSSDNKTVFEYKNDSFRIQDVNGNASTDTPKDVATGNNNVTAFLVSYGTENQSHFKTVNLNQAEFKETQESLMVIDQLAKGGDENNRSSKGQNLYNVYQTRSYTCEVEAMGNMQIQPLMYFQLENVPMFWGAYIITEVKHNIKPHYVTTTFKGTRVPQLVIPIVTDAYSTMVLGQTDPKKSSGSAADVIDSIPDKSAGINNISSGEPSTGPVPITSKPISKKTVAGIEVLEGQKYKSAGKLNSSKVTTVVLHWTAGWSFHADPTTSVGYQFTIDTDGGLWETNPIENKSSHAGCPPSKTQPCHGMNSKSVGISYVGGIKYHQKLGVDGIVDGVHNFPGNRQDNKIHGYPFTDAEWKMDELHLPYNAKKGKARTTVVSPKKQWDSIVNAILLAKAAHPTITNITSHHWTSRDKQDVRDEFPWDKLIGELRNRGFSEARLVTDWPDTDGPNKTGKTVYDKKLNLPENLFGPQAQEDQGNE